MKSRSTFLVRVLLALAFSVALMGMNCGPYDKQTAREQTLESLKDLSTASTALEEQMIENTPEQAADPAMVKLSSALAKVETIGKSPVATSLDLSKMAVEDAILLLMMLISNDAEKDMHEALEEMAEANKKRQALRDAIARTKDVLEEARTAMQGEYESLGASGASGGSGAVSNLTIEHNKQWRTVDELRAKPSPTDVVAPVSLSDVNHPVTAALDCANTRATEVSLVAIDILTGQELARSTSKNLTSLSFTPAPGTPVTFHASVVGTGILSNQITCALRWRYTGQARAPRPFSEDKIRILSGLSSQLQQKLGEARTEIVRLSSLNDRSFGPAFAASMLRTLGRVQTTAEVLSTTLSDLNEMTDQFHQEMETLSEMSEMDMLQLQQLMDQKSQLEQLISNTMKAAAEAQHGIVSNIKE